MRLIKKDFYKFFKYVGLRIGNDCKTTIEISKGQGRKPKKYFMYFKALQRRDLQFVSSIAFRAQPQSQQKI